MNIRTHSCRAVVGLLLSAVILPGCGYVQEGEPRPRAPNYASPIGTDYWEVTCGPNKIYFERNELDSFYNADGSQKSYTEFCRDVDASRIRRE